MSNLLLIDDIYYNDEGNPVCGAKKKNCSKCEYHFSKDDYDLSDCPTCGAFRPCANIVEVPGDRCHLHGGASPKGIASPNYKHGRRSKYMNTELAAKVETALADEELMFLRNDLALLEGFLVTALENIETGEHADYFKQAQKQMTRVRASQASKNKDRFIEALNALDDIISRGANQWAAIDEVRNMIEQRRKIIESERKRMVEMQQMISSEHLFMIIQTIAQSVKRNVNDATAIKNISDDISNIIGRSPE